MEIGFVSVISLLFSGRELKKVFIFTGHFPSITMFPRAKIHRFNEVKSDVPPPGTYDPKFDDKKFKGVVMDKMTHRFTEPKPTTNDGVLQRSASLNALPVFRTPQMPKKSVKKLTLSTTKKNPTPGDKVRRNIDSDFSSSEDLTPLKDKSQLISLEEQLHETNCKLLDSESKCKQLQNDISSDKETIERLELEKADLSKEVDRLIEEIAEQNSRLASLSESIHISDANLAERKAAVSELEQSKTELLLEMEILKDRVEQNKSEMEMSVRRCLELEGCVAEAKAENEKLVQIRLSLSDEVADLGERLNEASMQIQAREEHCETLEHAKRDLLILVDEKLLALDQLTSAIDESAKHSAQLEELLSESKARVFSLEETNSALDLKVIDLEEKLSSVTSELESSQSKCRSLEVEIEKCKEKLLDSQNAKSDLMAQISELECNLAALKESLAETAQSLTDQKALCQRETEEKEKLQKQVEELGLLSADLNQKLQQRQELILGLQSDLSNSSCELEERRAEAERQAKEYRAEIEQICLKHNEDLSLVQKDLEKNVADCEARVAQAQAEHEYELANLRDLAYKLEQQVLDERKTQKTLQEELDVEQDQHQRQIQALTENIQNSTSQRDHLETALAESQAELQAMQVSYDHLDHEMVEQVQQYKGMISEAQSKLHAAEEALKEEKLKAKQYIEEVTHNSERRISEIEQRTRLALEEAEIKLEAAEAAYTQTLQQVRDDTQALVKATRSDALQELEKVKAETEQKVMQAKEEVSTLSSKLEEVQEELRQVSTIKDDLRTSNLDKEMTIVELKDKMNIMETQLAQSQRQLDEAQDELEAVKNELELMKKIRRNLEILGNETLAIVNAVSKRLIDSDEEVDRLSQMNCALETTLNEQKESLIEMEEENVRDIQEMRNNLLEKVEIFKQKCVDENTRLLSEIKILQESVEMYANQLDEANRNIEILEKDRDEQGVIIASLHQTTNELQATQDFLANQVEDYLSVKKAHQLIQKELTECKDSLEKAKADAADGEMEIQHREKQINDLTNQVDDLNDKVMELQGVILELETAGVESEQEVIKLERKLEQQKDSALKCDWQIGELTRENEELRMQVGDLNRGLEEEKSSAKKAIDELVSAKAELQSQLDSLNTVLECHKMNVFKARERIETLVNVVARKESELEEKASEMNELKDELMSKTNQLSELAVIISDKDQALLCLHREADNLRDTVRAKDEQITNIFNDLDFEKVFRKECELKIAEMLQEKLGNEVLIEDMKEKVFELESTITEKNISITSLEAKVEESSERISILKAEAEDSLKQITEAEKTIVILEAGRIKTETDLDSLNVKVAEQSEIIEKQSVNISELDAEVQNQSDLAKFLQTRVEENRKEVEKLEEDKMALQSEISSLKMQNEMIQWENEESLQKAKKEVESQKEEILALTDQVKKIRLDVEKEKTVGREREEALTEEISSLKISLGAKTQEVGTVRGRVQHLEAELEQTTRRKETYKAAVVELQQAIKQSRSKMSSLEDDLKATQQKLTNERESHSKELENLRETSANATSWEQRYYELEALVGPFREQLEAFESDRQALAIRKEAAEGEVKELSQRYAQILGHQNHKQKIHHVVKLKEQILDLKKENDKLETQTRAQKRTIDRLKDELTRATGQSRFNPSMAFKQQPDDSFQNRLSLAHSKSFLENSGLSKSFRVPMHQSTVKKGKENMSTFESSTPLSARTTSKINSHEEDTASRNRFLTSCFARKLRSAIVKFDSLDPLCVEEAARIVRKLINNPELRKLHLIPSNCRIELPDDERQKQLLERRGIQMLQKVATSLQMEELTLGCMEDITSYSKDLLNLLVENQSSTLRILGLATLKDDPDDYLLPEIDGSLFQNFRHLQVT
ncbi:hypothetical protein FOCC_FOCC000080 [Frankliniella occidentalis]|nr:hypothetical protein FOCC_FOCC000080 [Frankliniella occidentalis]